MYDGDYEITSSWTRDLGLKNPFRGLERPESKNQRVRYFTPNSYHGGGS